MNQKPSDNRANAGSDEHGAERKWLTWVIIFTWWLAVVVAYRIFISAKPRTLPLYYLWFPCILLAMGIGLKISWSPVRALLTSSWRIEPVRSTRQALVQVFIAGTFGVFSDIVISLAIPASWLFRQIFPEELRKRWRDDWRSKK